MTSICVKKALRQQMGNGEVRAGLPKETVFSHLLTLETESQ